MTALVEALSWDITLGAAGTSFGRYILSSTSSSEEQAPDSIDHTGVKVFGNLYEFGDLGILTNPVEEGTEPKSKYPAFSLRSAEEVGYTSKTQEEFEAWVEEQNNGDYAGSNYDVVTRSCVVWAKVATEFLGVEHPPNWDKIIQWAEKNKGFTSHVGSIGMGARAIQHKAEEYYQDSKIKSKVKKLYKRLRRRKRSAGLINAVNEGEDSQPPGEVHSDDDEDDDDDDDDDIPNLDDLTEEEIAKLQELCLQDG